MYAGNQTTILNEVSCFGNIKDTNINVNVKFLPAHEKDGIIFKRTDLKENNIIKLNYNNIYIENNSINIKNEFGVSIKNIEIIIASIWCGRIDNINIELDNEQFPYIDGTVEPISFILNIAKNKELDKIRNVFMIEDQKFSKIDDDFELSLKEDNTFKVVIKNQNEEFIFDNRYLPFKDYLSKINDKNDIKYQTILIIAIIFISKKYCLFNLEIKNFDLNKTFEFFKDFFKEKK